MKSVMELEKLGYKFSLKGDNLTFHFKGTHSPSPDVVGPLFKQLRQNKNKAIEFIKERAFREVQQRLRYNALLKREQTAEAWMDDPKRTDAEVEKWMPLFREILTGLNSLINEIGLNNCTEAERLKGFDVMPLLGTGVSLDELPKEWQGGVNDAKLYTKAI